MMADANGGHEANQMYDVYLSFKGIDDDESSSVVNVLCNAFLRKGLILFIDDLPYGDDFMLSIVKGIEESRILVVLITQNYVSSRWCLEELAKMLECMKLKNQRVCPIFFRVNPSDVRHQRGSFGEAMALHERGFGAHSPELQKWRSALFEVTNLSGWHFQNDGEKYAFEFAEKIGDWIAHSIFSYDVFLSCSGKDTRYSFTGFLSNVLRREGFKTFMDDEGWVDGNQISQFHIKAIEESKFSIIVFSENYAYSSCCLDAPVKILECKKLKKQRVFPIFYKVQSTDVNTTTQVTFNDI